MKKEIIITISLFCLIFFCILFFSSKAIREPVGETFKKAASIFTLYSQLSIRPSQFGAKAAEKYFQKAELPIDLTARNKSPTKKIIIQDVALKQASFLDLPGWDSTDIKKSLYVFQNSCKKFLNQHPDQSGGSKYIDLRASDWQPPCRVALSIDPITDKSAKGFFENWFAPIEFKKNKPLFGLFTGYYMPVIKGNLTRTKQYNIPIYSVSANHDSKKNKSPQKSVIAWVKNSHERLFLQIEGAGIIQFRDLSATLR